uniref:Exosome component 3 n=14 Tax=Neoaves TaxID=3078114 RepID=A0A663F2B5_AQUCH
PGCKEAQRDRRGAETRCASLLASFPTRWFGLGRDRGTEEIHWLNAPSGCLKFQFGALPAFPSGSTGTISPSDDFHVRPGSQQTTERGGCGNIFLKDSESQVLLQGKGSSAGLLPSPAHLPPVAAQFVSSPAHARIQGELVVADACAGCMGSEMSFLPDFGIFTMGMWSVGLGAIGAAVTGIVLANTDLFLSKPEKATLEFLEEIELKTLGSEQRTFKAGELWKKNGAVIMAVRRPG